MHSLLTQVQATQTWHAGAMHPLAVHVETPAGMLLECVRS